MQLAKTSLRSRQTLSYFASFVALGLFIAALGPTLPGLAGNVGATLRDIGFLFTARSFGYLTGAIVGGQLFDRLDGHRVMFPSLLTIVVLLMLVPFISSLFLLAGVMLILGIAAGTIDIGGNTLLVWLHPENLSPHMNGLHFSFGVGALLAPLLLVPVLWFSENLTYLYPVLGVLILPVALWMVRLPAPPIGSEKRSDAGETPNYLLLVLIAVFYLVYAGAEVSFSGWIFTFATESGYVNITSGAYLTSAFWAALTTGRLLSIPLSRHIPPQRVLAGGLIGILCFMVILWRSADTALGLWSGVIGTGFFAAPLFPTALAFAGRHLTISGVVNSWFFGGASVGAMSVPLLIGYLMNAHGPNILIPSVLILFSVALLLVWAMILTTRE